MGQSLELAGARGLTSARFPAARQAPNRRAAKSPGTDMDVARVCATNLLLVGAEQALATVVLSLWSSLSEPLMIRRRGDRLRLPPTSEPLATMIIQSVETLTEHEQRALEDWLVVRDGRTRVVSTTSSSLLPMVEAGAFRAALYYRLNVFCIDLNNR